MAKLFPYGNKLEAHNFSYKILNQESFTTKCNSGQREKSQTLQRTAMSNM